jgi:uncharacterized protein
VADPIIVAKSDHDLVLLPGMANRHGLIAGATGTGKTVTLQVLAESFSRIGVPVFAADVKGDLSGISQAGTEKPKIAERIQQLGLTGFSYEATPTVFWDVFGEEGHPVRATVSEMGPLLLARLFNLNEIQTGVLNIVFRLADEDGLLLLDLADLRSMLQYVGENASTLTTEYGNVAPASIGAIQRGLLALEEQGGDKLFGEPALNLQDLIQTDSHGRGIVNLIAADKLIQSPKVYATFLLWLLSELFEQLPEVGDTEKPKLVFFFDEAHLLFEDMPQALQDRIEQVVRLIRSKGIGVYFVTQNPIDLPDKVLGQLGNRVQHALRAFTPHDQEAIKKSADTFRTNPKLDVGTALTELGVGEALVSLLDEKGTPGIVERGFVLPPRGQIGAITPEQRAEVIKNSAVAGFYEKIVDRESAKEMLAKKAEASAAAAEAEAAQKAAEKAAKQAPAPKAPRPKAAPRQRESVGEAMAKSTMRSIGSSLGRQLVRGVLGGLFRKS